MMMWDGVHHGCVTPRKRENEIVQVTILWEDAEIGYGEGETESYARVEALDSVDSMYASIIDGDDVTVQVVRS